MPLPFFCLPSSATLSYSCTKGYLEALAQANSVKSTELIESKMGRHHGGTWGHPKIAVFFARWLDVKFVPCKFSKLFLIYLYYSYSYVTS